MGVSAIFSDHVESNEYDQNKTACKQYEKGKLDIILCLQDLVSCQQLCVVVIQNGVLCVQELDTLLQLLHKIVT